MKLINSDVFFKRNFIMKGGRF